MNKFEQLISDIVNGIFSDYKKSLVNMSRSERAEAVRLIGQELGNEKALEVATFIIRGFKK